MKKHILPLLAIIASLGVWGFFYRTLPNQMASHWSIGSGEVDGYSSKISNFFMLNGILILLYVLLIFAPRMDPKKNNYKAFSSSYGIMTSVIMLVLSGVNIFVVLWNAGYDVPMTRIAPIVLGIIFLVIGNFMPKVRPNFFVGIRTPWALSNDSVWRKTHRFTSKLYFVSGVIFFLLVFLPASLINWIIIPIIVMLVIVPTVHSYMVYRKELT